MTNPRPLEGKPTVLADANVLFSQEQRNVVMTLATENLFRLHWTADIEDEWVRNRRRVLMKKGMDADAPLRTAERMRRALPDHDPGEWRHLTEETGNTHTGDKHVAAASIACAPSHLLTWNLKHFDIDHLKSHGVTVQDPDEFLCDIYDEDAVITYEAARKAHGFARSVARRVMTWAEYLERLTRSGLPRFAVQLRDHDPNDTLEELPNLLSDDEDPNGGLSGGP